MVSESITTIFEQYNVEVRRYALSRTGDLELADDVTSDVFSRLFNLMADGKGPETNLRAYLLTAAHNTVITYYHNSKKYAPLEIALNVPDDHRRRPVEYEVDKRLEARERSDIVQITYKLMEADLTVEQRRILTLRFLRGLSLKETAEALGKSENNIKVIQFRVLGMIREILPVRFRSAIDE